MVVPPNPIKKTSPEIWAYCFVKKLLAPEFQKSGWAIVLPDGTFREDFLQTLMALKSKFSYELRFFPLYSTSPYSGFTPSLQEKIQRLGTLRSITHNTQKQIVILEPKDLFQPVISPEFYQDLTFELRLGAAFESQESLRTRMKNLGYVHADLTEEPGQFTLRGDRFDLWIPGDTAPHRLDCFDTEVESIHLFDPESQRTLTSTNLTSVRVTPAEEALIPWSNLEPFLDLIKEDADQRAISRKIRDPIFERLRMGYLPEGTHTWIPWCDPKFSNIEPYLKNFEWVTLPTAFSEESVSLPEELIRIKDQLAHEWNEDQKSERFLSSEPSRLLPTARTKIEEQLETFYPEVEALSSDAHVKRNDAEIQLWLDQGATVYVGTRGPSHQERIQHHFPISAAFKNFVFLDRDFKNAFHDVFLNRYFLPEASLIQLGSNEKKRSGLEPDFSKIPKSNREAFRGIEDLNPGDYVVHTLHGIGRFIDLQTLKRGNENVGEYLLIEYQGGDKLYLPVYRLAQIQKYTGGSETAPLDKLGGPGFEKAKQKARESAKKLAINLIEIYAKRTQIQGPRFLPRDESFEKFCDRFEFQETEGQIRSLEDIFSDLESGKLMDRLVCGDVGFGKTEVAIRAAFQGVQSGYQVAVLVPTTLLAFQHEQSFRKRMKDEPIRIESISRFKTKREQTQILKDTLEGKVDILIGTHRLLSKDVKFQDLGLLIIDEEHRFGVEHKEIIKEIQTKTHALTLTATPIPRTLNQALSSIKDLSVITTPPTNRQPIKTFVAPYTESLMTKAIEQELSRGGQVYVLYNRVATIEKFRNQVQALFPKVSIEVAHGQLSESDIEDRMLRFYRGETQILICSTLVESGIDVPNAGTMIIHRADQLGLAQLYQIRGRVGRSHRRSYCYLLTENERILTEDAKLRLDALQRFVELGSGFQIANMDLEIRGGGNLLGAEQSGHIASVGLDLFTEMLDEAIAELQGKVRQNNFEVDPEVQVPVRAEIPSSFLPSSKLRIQKYRTLSRAKDLSSIEELFQAWTDQHGTLPEETQNLFWVMKLKLLLKQVHAESISITPKSTKVIAHPSHLFSGDEMMKAWRGPKGYRVQGFEITHDKQFELKWPFIDLKSHYYELEKLFRNLAPKAYH